MNLKNSFLLIIRLLLFPFALLYGVIVKVRNTLYDKNILHSIQFSTPTICIGNLSVGGTGKTPMVEYIIRLLQTKYNIATLSRGYKRKTKGFFLANRYSTAQQIGDEPMQFHQRFPQIQVAVAEDRVLGIIAIKNQCPQTEVIILDDAFQHRPVKAGYNILLSDYSHRFTKDFFLPTGSLRDSVQSYKRADIIVITKCPATLSHSEREKIKREIQLLPHQSIFFATIQYGALYHLFTQENINITANTHVITVSSIANPTPMLQHIQEQAAAITPLIFKDHHHFNTEDIHKIIQTYQQLDTPKSIIVTTEKDAVKLILFKELLKNIPIFTLPIQHQILFQEQTIFEQKILRYVSENAQS